MLSIVSLMSLCELGWCPEIPPQSMRLKLNGKKKIMTFHPTALFSLTSGKVRSLTELGAHLSLRNVKQVHLPSSTINLPGKAQPMKEYHTLMKEVCS